jgi:hypothetical protein
MKRIFLIVFITVLIVACKGKEVPKEVAPPPSPEVAAPVETKVQEEAQPAPEVRGPNQPPRVTAIDVDPLFPKIGDTLKVTATAIDPDGDEVSFSYEWFKNDTRLTEISNSLKLTPNEFKRGDNITLNVIPNDGKVMGAIGMMKGTVGNSPPEITSSSSESKIDGNRFTYQIKAKDPEGDSLIYSLKSAPTGMTINPATGFIQWDIPYDLKGKAPVTVLVSDGQGGEAVQNFAIEMTIPK